MHLPLLLTLLTLLTLTLAATTTTDLYKILQLDKSANDRDLKRAYRTLSKKYHPDKSSGDETKFLEVAEAYETLSDPTTRKIYDQYGHDGLANHKRTGGAQQHNPFDLFSQFFGGGRGQQGVRRGHDMEVKLSIPLRDFYTGREVPFSLEKQQICDTCEGSGSADGHVETCSRCNGRGMIIQKHMLAPGMFQQVQSHCDVCGGQGKTIKKPCKTCGGAKVVRGRIDLVADVEPGMPRGHRIVFENEADEHPDYVAGNLNVVVDELAAKIDTSESDEARRSRNDGAFFRRKGPDLYWKEVLSLREAWMGGWTRNLTHLDGHVVPLSRGRGEVVQPGQVESVAGEGIPSWQEGHVHEHDEHHESHGKLHVEYVVVLPDQMESGMEKEFWSLWEKWRKKNGVDLLKDSGRPAAVVQDVKDEL
ncbi:DnaJ- protein scj1 [Knufia obscura]|uniref:DnaJ- protein scj1 n=2 Tax=Knufia TaxID=430999 RepID=A0AAN8IKB0_9EURO|nr:DnaJ- protein scj1 [Knufia obscura]KAK5950992.1 DnaJ- protein scj1 [Knufia fluminis]